MQRFRLIGRSIPGTLLLLACQSSVSSSGGPGQPASPGAQQPPTAAPDPGPPPAATGETTSPPPGYPEPQPDPGQPAPQPTPTDPASTQPTPGQPQPAPEGWPTTIPTTIPTAIPTAWPTTLPTQIPSAGPSETPPATTPVGGSSVRTEGDRILVPGNIVFDTGRAILSPTPENQTILTQLKQFLVDNPKVTTLRIEGYTDNVGQPEANLKLSGERALAIKHWLVANGISGDRIIAVGFGQEKPIADNATPAARAQNRRTEFKIAAVNNRPYRGVPVNGGGTEFK